MLSRICAIALCVVVISLCVLSPLSVAYATDEIIVGEIIELIIETLKAWGIDIYSEISENVEKWVNQELFEYIEDELSESWNTWITGMNWIYDNFGRRMLNAIGLNNIYAFATYLQSKLNLTDNSTVSTEASYVIGDLVCYKLPVTALQNQTSHPNWSTYIADGESDVYIAFYSNTNVDFLTGYYAFSKSPFSVTVNNIKPNGTTSGLLTTSIDSQLGSWYAGTVSPSTTQIGKSANPWITYYSSKQSIIDALTASQNITVTPPVVITAGDITYPIDDPSYENGMSIIYYPDGTVGYLQINWPSSYSVDNLPAIVSTGNVQNPGIQSVFLPIKAFINTFSDGFGLITQIVYRMPSEIVGMALAIMGGIIIFGTIKIMKEH